MAAQSALTLLKSKLKNIPACERFFRDSSNAPRKSTTSNVSRSRPAPTVAPKSSPPVYAAPAPQISSNVDDSNDVYDSEPRLKCNHCGRSFVESSFDKHQKFCIKVFQQKRNTFDSTAMRLDGREDAAMTLRKLKEEERAAMKKQNQKKKPETTNAPPKWKVQSLQFQASIGNKEAAAELEALGAKGVLNQVPGLVEDKVQCQFCGRTFASEAAKRHIPVCETNSQKTKVTGRSYGPTSLKKGGGIQASANVKRKF